MAYEPKSSTVDCNDGARRFVCCLGILDLLANK